MKQRFVRKFILEHNLALMGLVETEVKEVNMGGVFRAIAKGWIVICNYFSSPRAYLDFEYPDPDIHEDLSISALWISNMWISLLQLNSWIHSSLPCKRLQHSRKEAMCSAMEVLRPSWLGHAVKPNICWNRC